MHFACSSGRNRVRIRRTSETYALRLGSNQSASLTESDMVHFGNYKNSTSNLLSITQHGTHYNSK